MNWDMKSFGQLTKLQNYLKKNLKIEDNIHNTFSS